MSLLKKNKNLDILPIDPPTIHPDNILITSLATRSSSTTLLKVNYSAIKMEFIEFCEA